MNPPNQPPPMIPLAPRHNASYALETSGGVTWTYTLDAPGADLGLRRGTLAVVGADVPLADAKPGARVHTPWGRMFRTGDDPANPSWLPDDGPSGYPVEAIIAVPEPALSREGTWSASTLAPTPWRYREEVTALGTRSEGRHATLSYGRMRVVGAKPGDFVDTPWGRMRWLGERIEGRYESGFLLRRTYDRPLDDMTGDPVEPTSHEPGVTFASLYLDDGVQFERDGRRCHGVALELEADLEHHDALRATLTLDPNACSLNEFGDRAGCTKMGVAQLSVTIDRLRTADPTGGDRRLYQVQGAELADGVHLIARPNEPWCVLKVGGRLIPLF